MLQLEGGIKIILEYLVNGIIAILDLVNGIIAILNLVNGIIAILDLVNGIIAILKPYLWLDWSMV